MNNSITTYYIPNNPNIQKGIIYTLYINNNKNLDLTSIINKENITVNTLLAPKPQNNKNKLLEISNQIDDLLKNVIKDIDSFVIKEKETLSTILNKTKEYQTILKGENKND